ncbi:MAG TPA: glycosyltransferase [Verrucomicrobiae bacterium]|nr:glycosyltransferase [Verrucomicrobiae bacterium]
MTEMIAAPAQAKQIPTSPARAVEISFLIPMYNRLDLTRECLRSLEATVALSRHEVILINDASTDGTAQFLSALSAPYRVVHNPQRSSYAVSMNRGVAITHGEMLCLLNNDLVFRPGWLPPMLRAFEKFKDAGVVGNVQISPRTGRYDHLGVVFGPNVSPVHFGTGFAFRPFRGFTRWQAVTAACCLVKKSDFLGAGGFDEKFINGFEDVDLCLKLGQKGLRHYVANGSIIEHHVSASEGRARHEMENIRLFQERWAAQMPSIVTPRERRLFAANYLLRCVCKRSHFRAKKAAKALVTLLKCGH